jgi:cytochrome c oxidase subunit 2
MVLAVVLVLLVLGSLLFHFLSPWYFTPIASDWGTIDNTVSITFWVTGIVFVAINLFMAYSIWRFRHRRGSRAAYEPENKKLEGWLTVVTAIGVAAMLAPGLVVWAKFVDVPQNASVVEVVGQQWYWSYRFPGKDGILGTVDVRNVSDQNPFGMSPDDPNGKDDVLISSPELHLPIGKPVKVLLRSKDVLHDFTVPQFRVKMDLVPGTVTHAWFTPTRTGQFDLLCEELCGLAHFAMRGRVVVDEEPQFRTWLASYPTYAETLAQAPGDPTAGKALFGVCTACHGAQAEGNPALNAPKLSGQGDWYLKRQLKYFKAGARGTDDKDTYGKQMAPMAATLSNDTAVNDVVAYIKTLPDDLSAPTVKGNVEAGRNAFRTCAVCHGADAKGNQAVNAPRLSGMSDWYLRRQLMNYQHGIRGANRKDMYGSQMAMMAAVLTSEKATDDVVAYINTLR